MGWRDLGLVHWDNRGQGTNAQAGDDTPQDHHGHTICEGLERASNEKDHGPIHYSPSSTNHVTYSSHTE